MVAPVVPMGAFELLPPSGFSTIDSIHFHLVPDLVYDPSNGMSITREVRIRDAVRGTEIDNVQISSNASWLYLAVGDSTGGARNLLLQTIQNNSSTSEEKNFNLNVPDIASLSSGVYHATVTISGDSTASVFLDITMNVLAGSSGVKKESAPATIELAPNPSNGVVTIHSPSAISSVEVLNLLGEKVLDYPHVQSSELTLDIAKLTAGIYFVKIETEDGITISKVIRE